MCLRRSFPADFLTTTPVILQVRHYRLSVSSSKSYIVQHRRYAILQERYRCYVISHVLRIVLSLTSYFLPCHMSHFARCVLRDILHIGTLPIKQNCARWNLWSVYVLIASSSGKHDCTRRIAQTQQSCFILLLSSGTKGLLHYVTVTLFSCSFDQQESGATLPVEHYIFYSSLCYI